MGEMPHGRVPAGPSWSASPEPQGVSALPGDHPSRGVELTGRLAPSHLRIYRRIADGTTGAFMAPGDVRMLLDEIVRLERQTAADVVGALRGISDDFMTSERHHPGYVLIPSAKFEQLCAAEATLAAPAPPASATVHDSPLGPAETPEVSSASRGGEGE